MSAMSTSIVPDYPNMTIQMIGDETSPIQVVLTSRVTTTGMPRGDGDTANRWRQCRVGSVNGGVM